MESFLPSAKEQNKAVCHICGRAQNAQRKRCERCNTPLHLRKHDSIQRCLAFCLASIIAYIPANIWPIMIVQEFGTSEPTTILGGVVQFWQSKVYSVSLIIFTASVLIPGLKIASLFWLCAVAKGWAQAEGKFATKIYWVTELVGRWSMLDVFVVAILVGLIQIGNIMSISAGPAVVAFALMVIFTMFAAHSFDPRTIWDQIRRQKQRSTSKQPDLSPH